jgi:WhiB family redox-sensing transcriptional regulator
MDNAACTGAGYTIFFPEKIGDTSTSQWSEAKTFCEQCTVKKQCLKMALENEAASGQRDGMWGGLTPNEREVFARKFL